MVFIFWFCVFKQKTAYEMRISDWSSDVCSSVLASDEQQLERADLELVAIREGRVLDPLPVEVRAVERADVGQAVAVVGLADLGVPAGHGAVVEEDDAVGVAPRGHARLVEGEAGAGVWAAGDPEHAAHWGELGEGAPSLLGGPFDGHG